jgi:two-component system sensor histidine kinase DesK
MKICKITKTKEYLSLSSLNFKEYYQFPHSVKNEFRVIPWLQLLVYIPLAIEPISAKVLAAVLLSHGVIFAALFKAYWLNDEHVVWPFLLALVASFICSFYSLVSIGLFAITVRVAMAHHDFKRRVYFVIAIVSVFLLSAWLQNYSTLVLFVGLFFTLVNGISVCYQVESLYKQVAIKQSQEEVRLVATSTERERIAYDLHDVLGQSLTGITLKAELALKTIDKDSRITKQQLDEIIDISRSTLKEVRETVSGYRQSSIENELVSARIGFGTLGINFDCTVDDFQIEQGTEQALAWIIREATTNIMRHANASRCQLTLTKKGKQLRLTIKDNGITSPDTQLQQQIGTGLTSIKQRCHAINGKFSLITIPSYILTVTKEIT